MSNDKLLENGLKRSKKLISNHITALYFVNEQLKSINNEKYNEVNKKLLQELIDATIINPSQFPLINREQLAKMGKL